MSDSSLRNSSVIWGGPSPVPSPEPDVSRYVNGVLVQQSPWDFVLDLRHQYLIADRGREGEEPSVASQTVARIVMSPQHAKALHALLGEALSAWEQSFGELRDLRTAT